MGKILSGVAVLVLVWVARFAINLVSADPVLVDASPEEWIAQENQWVHEELAAGTAVPAVGWLDHEKHGTFEADPRFLDELIDEFAAAGAVNVYMVGVESFAGGQLSDSIAVELPADPGVRAELFAIEARVWGGEGTPDVGQAFLTLSMD